MHEIITIQLGGHANYLGTHYWNVQESYFTYDDATHTEIDHDRSFRQGIGVDGFDTYTPRALIYDLKNAFGTLRRDNALYENQQSEDLLRHNAWGNVSTIQLPAIPESSYQQALNAGAQPEPLQASTVRYWSDYNHIFYHPRSMIQLNEYEVNSSLMPFERYATGEDLFASVDKEHDILDRDLRPLLEECDQLQAINMLASTTDAWGGFASKYLERMSDELGKGGRWLFGLQDKMSMDHTRRSLHLLNIAQCLEASTPHVSLSFPIQNPTRSTALSQFQHPWQASALQAAALESLTLPTRLKQDTPGSATTHELEQVLNLDGHRALVTMGLTIEDPSIVQRTQREDSRMANGLEHDNDLDTEKLAQIDLFPSLPGRSRASRLFSSIEIFRQDSNIIDFDPGSEINNAGTRMTDRIGLAFPMLSSFPRNLFTSHEIDEQLNISVVSSSSERVARYLRACALASRSLLQVDVREALYDGLVNIAEEYEESMSFSDSDGIDDD